LNNSQPFRCPKCLGELVDAAREFQCSACNRRHPIIQGVPILVRDRDFYGGAVPKRAMREILSRMSSIGWDGAAWEYARSSGDTNFYNSISESRAAFKFLLDRFEKGTVLDYGCGLGAVTTSLARNFAAVYATDRTFEHAQFTSIRAEQENLHNVTVFCSGDTPHIPLADGSVDVIVVNDQSGLIPEHGPADPRPTPLEFLTELRRILARDGILYWGIENHFGYGYLLGLDEEHSLFRSLASLPRKVLNFRSRSARKKPNPFYPYSRSGYRTLLKSAGFPASDFWGLVPNHLQTEKAIRLSDKTMIRESFNNQTLPKRIRNLALRPLFPSIVGSFGILAGTEMAEPYVARLARHISETYLNGQKSRVSRYVVRGWGAVQLHLSSHNAKYFVKLPLSARAEQRLEAAVRNVEQLEACLGGFLETSLIPRPVTWGRYLGQAFSLEPAIPGQSLDQVSANEVRKVFPKLCDYLARFCNATRKPGGTWSEILSGNARKYGRQIIQACRQRGNSGERFEETILGLADYLARAVPPDTGFYCTTHGDFWHGNIMATGKKIRLSGILDWDRSEVESLPFLDLCNLLTQHETWRHGTDWSRSVIKVHKALFAESPEAEPVRTYAVKIGASESLASQVLIVYWLKECIHILHHGTSHSAFEGAIFEPLKYFHELAGTVERLPPARLEVVAQP
jgi:SAM-dependent methyltransferase